MTEYPIIEVGTIIEWTSPTPLGDIEDLVEVVSIYADEDGVVQLRIKESAPDSLPGPRSIKLEDLHEQMEWRDYEVREDIESINIE